MAHTVTDIAELVEYHLVVSSPDDNVAHANLVQLVRRIEGFTPRPLWQEAAWVFCDRCGCAVDTDVIAEDGSNWTASGDFLCSSCLYPDEE